MKDKHDHSTLDLVAGIACPEKSELYLTHQQRESILNSARFEAGMDYRMEATNRNPFEELSLAWRTYEEEFRLLLEEYEP